MKNLPTQDMIKMGIVVTSVTSRGPRSKYRAPLSVPLHLILQFPWRSNDMLSAFFHLLYLLVFAELDWRHTAGKGMEFSYRLVLGPFLLVVLEVLVESGWYSPSIRMNNSLSYDHQTHMLSIVCLPFCNHACSARASNNTHISFTEGEVGGITLLVGYPGVRLGLHLPSTERIYSLTTSASYPDASFPIPVLPH